MKKNLAALVAGVCLAGALQASKDLNVSTINSADQMYVASAESKDSSSLTLKWVAQKDAKAAKVASVWEALMRGVNVPGWGQKRVVWHSDRTYDIVREGEEGLAAYRARDSRLLDIVQRLAGMHASDLNSVEGQLVKAEVESLRGVLPGDDGMAADCLASMLNALEHKPKIETESVMVDDGAELPQRAVQVEIPLAAAAQPQRAEVLEKENASLRTQLAAKNEEIERLKAEVAKLKQEANLPEATQVND